MPEISRAASFGKLSPLAYQAIEGATVLCKMRGNPYVELTHWLMQILNAPDSDLHRIARHAGLDASALAADLTQALERLPRGAASISDISAFVDSAVERGWVYASLMFGQRRIRTGHLLVGMLKTPSLRGALMGISRQWERVDAEKLCAGFDAIVGDSPEAAVDEPAEPGAAPGEASGAIAPAALGRAEALQRFTTDLTAQAREGTMDPIVGRDDEIRQVVDILMRRRQNNPILVGEAGVGKTAVVEGFAQRIVRGDVPPALREVELRALDVGLLQAGASMKGEFEQRLRAVIDEVQASPKPVVLFIDETHTLVGAGGAAGTGDAANLLKPALARGVLRTIGATTFAEYKKHIEKDPALTRRFQSVQIDEPDEARATRMMRGVASTMEQHHRVQILDEALQAAVRLSHRYIPARQLPDKSVSLLDTACARVAVSLHAVPAEVDDSARRIESLQTEAAIVEREAAIGIDTGGRGAAVAAALADERARQDGLQARWQSEKALVDRLLALRARLRGALEAVERAQPAAGDAATAAAAVDAPAGPSAAAGGAAAVPSAAADGSAASPAASGGQGAAQGALPVSHTASAARAAAAAPPTAPAGTPAADDPAARAAALAELRSVQAELAALQGEHPLILPTVDAQAVASVVADWTGIPVGRMAADEIGTVLALPQRLAERVIGQDHAMEAIARRIQTARAGLDNPGKPVGVFLLAGTSGVGKTETAIALAEQLYGGEHNLIVINMSEYQEAHTVSTLKGAPPGYVGYGEGGVLTEAVRRRPYSVVLLDEVEKAHPDVHEVFYQVFDKGFMEDGEGRFIDFKNTLILLTTNVGTELVARLCQDPELRPEPEALAQALREPLLKAFPPALLGRLVTVPYYPLSDAVLSRIVRLQLQRIRQRVETRWQVPFEVADEVVRLVVSRCTESESGGRMIDAILTQTLLPEVSRALLTRQFEGRPVAAVKVGVADGQFAYAFD